jgi:hypothetical protein
VGGAVVDRARPVSRVERPILPRDFAGAIAHAGVDPTLEGRALQDALRAAIAVRGGYCWWDFDNACWVVTLHSPEEQEFSGKTLKSGSGSHPGSVQGPPDQRRHRSRCALRRGLSRTHSFHTTSR